jgi:hypothetical protein
VAGRYRALYQIVADVPDPIGDAYFRISKSWRSLSRQDRQLALVNLEGVGGTIRRAGWRWRVGRYGYPGSSRNDPVGAAVERCSVGAPADRDEDLLQARSPLARTVSLLQVVPVRVNQEPGARAGLARTVSCPSASSRNVFPVGNAALAGRMCCFSGHFGDSQVGQGPANRCQSERYAFFVAVAVEASTASSTRARASGGSARS